MTTVENRVVLKYQVKIMDNDNRSQQYCDNQKTKYKKVDDNGMES